jgi:hypothetical protein
MGAPTAAAKSIWLATNAYGQWLATICCPTTGRYLATELLFATLGSRTPDEHSLWEAMAAAEEAQDALTRRAA